MGEENTDKDIASASDNGSNLLGKPAESTNNKEASPTEKENQENAGVAETMEGIACNQTEDSKDKDDSVKTFSVEGNEVAEPDTVKEDTASQYNELKEGETKEVVELDSEKNKAVEQDNELKEVVPQEVAEPGTDKGDTAESGVEPKEGRTKEVAEQEGEKNKAVEQDNASENLVKAAAVEETLKKEMSGGITGDTEASAEDDHVKVAKYMNEEEIVDNNEVREGKENNGEVYEETMEVDREQEADATENKSVEEEGNSEEKGVDVKDGLETEKVEGNLQGSSNEEVKELEYKGSKKRKRKENAVGTKNAKKNEEAQTTPVSSVSTRPVRARKSVERLVASIEQDVVREFFVEKGPGTALKDIPNVAYKLSKKKNDETFKQLHPILFGRRGKAIQMKNHVSQFSGFVWHDNEEKNKMKVREKFDKLFKEKLIEFCDVLDIHIANKVSTKKEDIVTRILDFLASPHPTTDELLSEKEHSEKTTKRKRSVGPDSPTPGSTKSSRKRRRKTSEKPEDSGKSESGSEGESDKEKDEALTENQGNGNGKLNQFEDGSSEKKSSESEDAMDEDTTHHRQRLKKTSVKVDSPAKKRTKAKTLKNPDLNDSEDEKKMDAKNHKKSSNKSPEKMRSARKARISTEKKKQVKVVSEKESNIKTKNADLKGKPKEEKLKPSDKVLRNQICQILKEVDFNTATFTDILKLLGKHFKTDLTPRKASIKLIIQEELTKMADAVDAEDDDDDEEEEQDPSPKPAKINA